MTIKYIIEGPKGSGKSTLCKALALETESNIKNFSDKNTPHVDKMLKDYFSQQSFIHDRGYLSYHIYGWAQDAHQHFGIKQDSTRLTLETWSPITRKDFIQMLDLIDSKLVILYASKPQQLIDRIKSRESLEGKGATKTEYDSLYLSNAMFYSYIHILKTAYDLEGKDGSNKIVSIDISEDYSVTEIVKMIKEA